MYIHTPIYIYTYRYNYIYIYINTYRVYSDTLTNKIHTPLYTKPYNLPLFKNLIAAK